MMMIQSQPALVGNGLKTFRDRLSWWDIYGDFGQSNTSFQDRFTFWLGLNRAEFRVIWLCWLQRFLSRKFLVSQKPTKGWGVFHAQHTKQSGPPLRLFVSKLRHHSGFKLWCQQVLSITCWHERHTKTCWYITRLNWGGTDEITQCCQSSTTNYHETQGDANWLIKDFNWRGSEESFQLSVMNDWKCWHMIWSRKGCTLLNKRAGEKKYTLE